MQLHELFEGVASGNALYHFTPLRGFYLIIKTNTLLAHRRPGHDQVMRKSISFTRNLRRSFIAGGVWEGLGFRVDRAKLMTNYRVVPSVHSTTQKSVNISGVWQTPAELAISQRFESEERVYDRDIKNFLRYVTGIVIPVGGKWKKAPKGNLTELALTVLDFSGAFSTMSVEKRFAFDIRKEMLNTIKQLNVPIIFGMHEYTVGQVNGEIARLYDLKKTNKEQFNAIIASFFQIEQNRYKQTGEALPTLHNVRLSMGRGTYIWTRKS